MRQLLYGFLKSTTSDYVPDSDSSSLQLMLGVLVVRNPEGPFAKNAFKKMEEACDVFRNAKECFLPQADTVSGPNT